MTTATIEPDTSIQIGDLVRSFDFSDGPGGFDTDGERACFVEGTVEAILTRGEPHECGAVFHDCDRFVIRCTRKVFGGKENAARIGDLFFPPVNGIPKLFGGETNGVRKVEQSRLADSPVLDTLLAAFAKDAASVRIEGALDTDAAFIEWAAGWWQGLTVGPTVAEARANCDCGRPGHGKPKTSPGDCYA